MIDASARRAVRSPRQSGLPAEVKCVVAGCPHSPVRPHTEKPSLPKSRCFTRAEQRRPKLRSSIVS